MSRDIENLSDEDFDKYMNEAIAEGGMVEEEEEGDGTETEVEEDEVDTAEQPEDENESEDSDDNNDVDEEQVEETEEDSETDEGIQETVDEQPTKEETKPTADTHKVPTFRLKADGTEFDLTEDELKQLASKGMNYTKKMQDIKEYREHVSAIKEAALSKDDINLMIDVLKGDKDALATVMKRTGVDALDVDVENSRYVPKNYGRNEVELEIEEVVETISRDPEYVTTKHIISSNWDKQSQMEFVKDPIKIKKLHEDVKNGTFDQVVPMMLKKKALDGARKSDIEYYIEAGTDYYQNKAREAYNASVIEAEKAKKQADIKVVKEQEAKRSVVTETASKRKAATMTKPKTAKRSIDDYLNTAMSDDEFSKLMEKAIYKR